MVELGDQQVLARRGNLSVGDVEGKTAQMGEAPGGVELAFGGLLEPYFAAVGPDEAEGGVEHRIIGPNVAQQIKQARALVRVNAGQELRPAEIFFGAEAEDLCGVFAAL